MAYGAMLHIVVRQGKAANFAEVTLNKGTGTFFAQDRDGAPLQSDCSTTGSIDKCILGMTRREAKTRGLWLGNSQLHAINQYQEGQLNALPLLREGVSDLGIDLIALSPPNGTLIEHYVLFEYALSHGKIDKVLLAVCFDDTREVDVRPALRDLLERREMREKLQLSQTGRDLLKKYVIEDKINTVPTSTRKGLVTWQESSEAFLNRKLSDVWGLWASRENLRGLLALKMFLLRNKVFGITPQSKRRLLPARYGENIAAFESLLKTAQREQVDVLVYVVPIRHDVALPYVESEYEAFKDQMTALTAQYQMEFKNLEGIIPIELWGKKESTTGRTGLEIDFMHFQAPGHKFLADEVKAWLKTVR